MRFLAATLLAFFLLTPQVEAYDIVWNVPESMVSLYLMPQEVAYADAIGGVVCQIAERYGLENFSVYVWQETGRGGFVPLLMHKGKVAEECVRDEGPDIQSPENPADRLFVGV